MTADNSYPVPGVYSAPHPLLTGEHEIVSNDYVYTVNLDEGECSCQHGKAWAWSSNKWVHARWCIHKLKTLASLIESDAYSSAQKSELQSLYNRLLGDRYIIWESVSAFHKELRLGNENLARYWAISVAAHRGLNGVVRYLLNILFEETRDLALYGHLMNLSEKGRNVTYQEAMNAVRWFAQTPKKWELEGRLAIFVDEMAGYRKLAREHGYAVAKGKDIIESRHHDYLVKQLVTGFQTKNRVTVQEGLKGLFKSQHPKGHDELKRIIYRLLVSCLEGTGHFASKGNAFTYDKEWATSVCRLVKRRSITFGDIGYHDLNAFGDALCGETYACGSSTLRPTSRRLLLTAKRPYAPPLGTLLHIPLYALDNHNHRGKHLMRRWGATELLPGAHQENIDFRLCGAYMGVAWRYLAYNRYRNINTSWGSVSWTPNWLWTHLNDMWY